MQNINDFVRQICEADMANKVSLNCEIKDLLIMGDSYSTFAGYNPEGYEVYYSGTVGTDVRAVEETWWHRYITEKGINLVRNDSLSGSTVCFSGRNSPEWAYRTSFVNRLRNMISEGFFEENAIDSVFIFGATNDSRVSSVPRGELKFSGWTEEDLYSTMPALCYLISTLKELLPQGNIVFIINEDLDGRIVSGIKGASDHYGISYIELENIETMSNHPTVKGMGQICEQIISALK